VSHAEACWQEVEADKLRFGDLGRMPRRIVHPTQPHDRGWTNWIFAGWVPWRGHRAAYVMGLSPWPGNCWAHGRNHYNGELHRRVVLSETKARLTSWSCNTK